MKKKYLLFSGSIDDKALSGSGLPAFLLPGFSLPSWLKADPKLSTDLKQAVPLQETKQALPKQDSKGN